MILAGRSTDELDPAILIIEMDSEDSAHQFEKNDPFVKKGLMKASLYPFHAALVRNI
jgi:uncharacterized protein YciI